MRVMVAIFKKLKRPSLFKTHTKYKRTETNDKLVTGNALFATGSLTSTI